MTTDARADDAARIEAIVLDYFEGWFRGDATRMRRALHPRLAKRTLEADAVTLDETSAETMIDATARGDGRARGDDKVQIDVTIEDVHGSIANVTVRSSVYREYVQLARTADGWKIVNTLYALT